MAHPAVTDAWEQLVQALRNHAALGRDLQRRGLGLVQAAEAVKGLANSAVLLDEARFLIMEAGTLRARHIPAGTDLIVAAHAHDFLGKQTLGAAKLGAIGIGCRVSGG